jgi:hypothetical protein
MTNPQSTNEPDLTMPANESKPPATPRWVKITGAVVALIVLAVLAKVLFGGGVSGHGPGMHSSLGSISTPTSSGLALTPVPSLPGL